MACGAQVGNGHRNSLDVPAVPFDRQSLLYVGEDHQGDTYTPRTWNTPAPNFNNSLCLMHCVVALQRVAERLTPSATTCAYAAYRHAVH